MSDRNKHILLIDDDAATLLILAELISETGISTIEAQSGREAMELFQINAGHICLVVVDIQLPDIHGYDLIRYFRQYSKELPIVAISAQYPHDTEKMCLAAGANHFIPKPFKMKQFVQLILEYVSV